MTEIEWPFLGQEVLAAKALPERAMRSLYDPIYPGVYVPSGNAGLPKPQTQIVVRDDFGEFVPRIDMGYEDLRVGIEYDGPQHWTNAKQRDRDIDRYSALLDLGWVIVRVSSELLTYRQGTLIGRVEATMRAAGWQPDRRL